MAKDTKKKKAGVSMGTVEVLDEDEDDKKARI